MSKKKKNIQATDSGAHAPLKFPKRTKKQERAWLKRMCEADEGSISVGGLAVKLGMYRAPPQDPHVTINNYALRCLLREVKAARLMIPDDVLIYFIRGKILMNFRQATDETGILNFDIP